jgi:hypothetical protein
MRMRTDGSPANKDRAIASFIRGLAIMMTVRYSLTFTTVWFFLCGVATLSLRVATGQRKIELIWLVTGGLPAILLAGLLAVRRLPDRNAVSALIDQRSRCGGLLMASDRVDIGAWESRMPDFSEPRILWHARRAIVVMIASMLFALVSFLVPVATGAMDSERPLDVANEVARIAADTNVLKDEQIIDATQAESLQTQLDSIKAEANGQDPVKTWEALDHLRDAMSKTADEAADKLARQNEHLAQAQVLSETLGRDGSGLDSKLMTQAMKELQSQMRSAGGDQQATQAIPGELADALKSGSLTKEQMKELTEALKQSKANLARKLGKLSDARLIDLKKVKQCENAGKCDSAGLAEFLKENEESMTVSEMMRAWGKGGVDRGRGDAPMTWTDPSSERGARFKEKVLPSSLAGLKDSELVGRSVGAPDVEKLSSQRSGALNGAAAGGGSAFSHTVLPRHRRAVNTYFARH